MGLDNPTNGIVQEDHLTDFANRLQLFMGDDNQAQFARRVGINPQTLNHYFKNGTIPGPRTAAVIADALGTTADFLLYGREADKKPHPTLVRDRMVEWSFNDPKSAPAEVHWERAERTLKAALAMAGVQPTPRARDALFHLLLAHDIRATEIAAILVAFSDG